MHVARTQEGFVIESATADLLAVGWRRYKPEFEDKEGKIELCTEGIEFTALTEPVTKNGREIYGPNTGPFQKAISFFDIDSGKDFVCLKRGYLGTYKLLDSPLSFQHVDEKGEISWSTGQSGKFTYTRVQPSIVLEEIKVRCVALLAKQAVSATNPFNPNGNLTRSEDATLNPECFEFSSNIVAGLVVFPVAGPWRNGCD